MEKDAKPTETAQPPDETDESATWGGEGGGGQYRGGPTARGKNTPSAPREDQPDPDVTGSTNERSSFGGKTT